MNYYAELEMISEKEKVFIGIFSSTDKAQEAIAQERFYDRRILLWRGFGDQLRANAPEGVYVIIPLEVDRVIKYRR